MRSRMHVVSGFDILRRRDVGSRSSAECVWPHNYMSPQSAPSRHKLPDVTKCRSRIWSVRNWVAVPHRALHARRTKSCKIVDAPIASCHQHNIASISRDTSAPAGTIESSSGHWRIYYACARSRHAMLRALKLGQRVLMA